MFKNIVKWFLLAFIAAAAFFRAVVCKILFYKFRTGTLRTCGFGFRVGNHFFYRSHRVIRKYHLILFENRVTLCDHIQTFRCT